MIQWELHVIYNFTLRKLENFRILYWVMHLYKCINLNNIFFILNYRRESNNKEEKEEQQVAVL